MINTRGDDKGNGDDGMGVAWNTIIKIVQLQCRWESDGGM